MLLLALACTDPVDSGKDTDTAVVDTDTGVVDTDTACDPVVGTMAHPNFYTESLPAGAPISVTDVDPTATLDVGQSSLVYTPTSTTKSRLFVMLADVGGSPADIEKVMGISTLAGQRGIALAWPSSVDAAALCGDDLACRDSVAQELLTGAPVSPVVDVPAADSVQTRLVKLLQALEAANPGAGWSAYYTGDMPVYTSIIVAGYGYGASLAMELGRTTELSGSVFFAGGCESTTAEDGTVTLAPSCTSTRTTPSDRAYGILHTKDEYEARSLAFPALGMDLYGDYTSADSYEPRYCTSTHMLTTSLKDEGLGENWHLAVAHDDYISVDDRGMPLDAVDYWYMVTLADR